MIQALISWGPAAVWAGFLFLLSAQSDFPGIGHFPISDKVAHFGMFGVLGVTLAWGGRYQRATPAHLALLLIGAIFAATDEWHQAYVPRREPSVGDFGADVMGLAVGYFLAWMFLNSRRAREPGGEQGAEPGV